MPFFRKLVDFLKPESAMERCRRWNLPLWQCPDVIMLGIGALGVGTIAGAWIASARYEFSEELLVVIASVSAAGFLALGFLLSSTLERIGQANFVRTQFLRIASHQLRSPITATRWALSILRTDVVPKLSPDEARYIAIIDEATNRMHKVSEAVAEVSIAARLRPPKETFSLRELVEALGQEFSAPARAGGIRFEVRAGGGMCPVYADRDQMRYVLEVLLDNVLRYTKPGDTALLSFSCRENPEVRVRDTGMGIGKEEQEMMLQPFFRGSYAQAAWPGGMGLNLFAAKSIVEALGGTLTFSSQKERGSEFVVSLPRASS